MCATLSNWSLLKPDYTVRALVVSCDSAGNIKHAWPALTHTGTHRARAGSHDSRTLAHARMHTGEYVCGAMQGAAEINGRAC